MMLHVEGLSADYNGNHALKSVTLDIDEGEIAALIGANGAGKTTLLNCISGLHQNRVGKIHFDGVDISRSDTQRLVGMGIVHVPEYRQLFGPLTVAENLEMGAYSRFPGLKKKAYAAELDHVFRLFPSLKSRKTQRAGTLSGGEQQMTAIARGLMANPKLLLLDEPSLGLAPMVVKEIFRIIQRLKREGRTILLVEQNASGALAIADRGYVLQTGCVVLGGKAADLANDDRVKKAFLGDMQ
jgi:branched-chain amino acid transport system ATP-binding protein